MNVFISYAGKDLDAAENLANALKDREVNVWFDSENILPGQSWIKETERAISNSDAVIVLLSSNTGASSSVQSEIVSAVSKSFGAEPKLIIPVILEKKASIPAFLRDIHYVDFSDPAHYQSGVDRIARALKTLPGSVPASTDRYHSIEGFVDGQRQALNVAERSHLLLSADRTRMLTGAISFLAAVTTIVAFAVAISGVFDSDGSLGYLISFVLGVMSSVLASVLYGWTIGRRAKGNAHE